MATERLINPEVPTSVEVRLPKPKPEEVSVPDAGLDKKDAQAKPPGHRFANLSEPTSLEGADSLFARIEHLLSAGLGAEFATLSSDEQKVFKKEGEDLARWLRDACRSGAVSPYHVLMRIEKWLCIIEDGRSPHWLMREAHNRARMVLKAMRDSERGH
jgi:hypothetical protein